ncbi:MAG: efflux RND transporter periplasmic adaptor subunit [Planctomycetes bacterium]|nr:efflux RND transporter periplasmic adaptor subunit [Planctomycetota bacterium]
MKGLITLVVLAGLSAGGYYGYQRWLAPEDKPSYRTVEVQRGDVIATVSATGTIEPLVKVVVGTQVSGTVIKWYADFNQQVKEGEILLELDQDRYRATVEQRKASLAVAQSRREEAAARFAKATLDLEKVEQSLSRMAASEFEVRTSRTEVDAAAAALHASEAQVQASEADLRYSEVELSKTIIKSPIDGVVIKRDVDVGQTVAASLQAPTLFLIAADLRQMRVNAAVSETDIGRIKEQMAAQFRVDAFPGRKFRGVVSQVRFSETVVDNVVTYTTMIDVDNEELLLRPGMTATILFEVAKAEDTLLVPNAALRFDPAAASAPASASPANWFKPGKGMASKPRVYKLVRDDLVEVALSLGLNDGANTQILSGELAPGDAIVVERLVGPAAAARRGPPMGGGQMRGPRM